MACQSQRYCVLQLDIGSRNPASTYAGQPRGCCFAGKLLDVTELKRQGIWCLFVIGHYTGRISYPGYCPFCKVEQADIDSDWAICAFATEEASKIEGSDRRRGVA